MKQTRRIQHEQQFGPGYCLPACATMVLQSYGINRTQRQLAKLLGTESGIGTPFSHVIRLQQVKLTVELVRWQGIAKIQTALASNKLVIAAILTIPDLPGWEQLSTQHVVLVTNCDDQQITYHDPALSVGPTDVSLNAFWLAWTEMEEQAAILGASSAG